MRKIVGILFLAFAVFACQNAKDEFLIKGTISGVDKGKVYMLKLGEQTTEVIDSTEVSEGKFTFKGKMDLPDLRVLRLNDREFFAQFFLDNSKVTVVANKDSLRKTKVTGSPTNDVFMVFSDEMTKVQRQVTELQNKYIKAICKN